MDDGWKVVTKKKQRRKERALEQAAITTHWSWTLTLELVLEHLDLFDTARYVLISTYFLNLIESKWKYFTEVSLAHPKKFFPTRLWSSLATYPLFLLLLPYRSVGKARGERRARGIIPKSIQSDIAVFLCLQTLWQLDLSDWETVTFGSEEYGGTYAILGSFHNNDTAWIVAALLQNRQDPAYAINGEKFSFNPSKHTMHKMGQKDLAPVRNAGSIIHLDTWTDHSSDDDIPGSSQWGSDQWVDFSLKTRRYSTHICVYPSIYSFLTKYIPYLREYRTITRFLLAAGSGYISEIEGLLNDPFVVPTMTNLHGENCFHLACNILEPNKIICYSGVAEELPREYLGALKMLLERVPNRLLKDVDTKGRTPLDIAKTSGFVEGQLLLEQALISKVE